jgi:hypothetical protein
VTLEVGAAVGLAFVMQAGKVTEEVQVKGEAAVVQTEWADISSVVERKRIEDLPLVSRNPLALTALQPGVTGIPTRNDFRQPEQGSASNASGMRGGANSAYIDGMSINANPRAGTVLIVPNVEAVKEFQVIRPFWSNGCNRPPLWMRGDSEPTLEYQRNLLDMGW